MKSIRLTMSQALVKFLNAQFIEFDGKKHLLFKAFSLYSDMEMS